MTLPSFSWLHARRHDSRPRSHYRKLIDIELSIGLTIAVLIVLGFAVAALRAAVLTAGGPSV